MIAIVDMGFIWRLETPTNEDREKNDETFFSWHDYATKIFDIIPLRHTTAGMIILVNDPYDLDIKIVNMRVPIKMGGTKNVFIRPNNKLPNSQELNSYFKNKNNKMRLQQFLQNEFMEFCNQFRVTT